MKIFIILSYIRKITYFQVSIFYSTATLQFFFQFTKITLNEILPLSMDYDVAHRIQQVESSTT